MRILLARVMVNDKEYKDRCNGCVFNCDGICAFDSCDIDTFPCVETFDGKRVYFRWEIKDVLPAESEDWE